jgi:hypothetical protein
VLERIIPKPITLSALCFLDLFLFVNTLITEGLIVIDNDTKYILGEKKILSIFGAYFLSVKISI